MRVLYNTWSVAFACVGGGEIQLLKSAEAVRALGVEVVLFDQWKPQFREVDAVHFFSSGYAKPFCDYVKQIGLPLLISPIKWLTGEAITRPSQAMGQVLKLADKLLPNSCAEADQLAEAFGIDRDRFAITYNGVDPVFEQQGDPALFRRHFRLTRPFLLNVANIEPRKNQLALIRVLKDLDFDLVVLGNVRDDAYYQECLRQGGDRFRHLGYVEHGSALLRSAYAACQAFLLPSLLETPGLAALEAATQGARLLVTEVGSTREYFDDLVEYVDPHDDAGIRAAIERVLAQRPDPRLRQRILSNFTWQQTGQALVLAYRSVVAGARPGS